MKACNQCGKCCINYSDGGLSATQNEIDAWEAYRPDIFEYVKEGQIWVDPKSSLPLTLCPWLIKESPVKEQQGNNKSKYYCSIYEDRPEDCRYYPVSIADMIKDDCEMLEKKDLVNPKQAQQKLDSIMVDDRPALEN
jgi:Fe-S-cluster containining protein